MNATAPAPRRSTRKCANCSKRASFVVCNAFSSSANGKTVCRSNICWGFVTGGYPAEGKRIS